MSQPLSASQTHHPIGIFDSGVGGLSIAKCVQQLLPNEHIIYLADSLHAPYGSKPKDFIQLRVDSIARQLIDKKIKALVIACNTATVNAIDELRKKVAIPIIGVEPAIKPAAARSSSKKVGILVTEATASNRRFLTLVERFSSNVDVFIQPCPGLVELIERGDIEQPACDSLLNSFIQPLLDKGVDTLVLGCTHYPFLIDKIKKQVNHKLEIMETAEPVTRELQRQLAQRNLLAPDSQQAQYSFLSSHTSPQSESVFSELWQQKIRLQLI